MCGTDMVTIRVGPEAVPFYVHKRLLTYWSPYFRNAFDGSWMEADRGISLSDVEPWLFEVVNGWLYTQSIVLEPPAQESFDASDITTAEAGLESGETTSKEQIP
ncbi:hypothetical protein BU16DRAFT_269765 [Lophium mytilinum]|uniref:BTB domain-containing protein n=1 Tax=Lophium mytilinum TaxID=390894 RepID=A0A6A6R4U7_9PEZI|nr:hypothetical protein BU16DRAFT_269765 [Lophium mytilinum]